MSKMCDFCETVVPDEDNACWNCNQKVFMEVEDDDQ